MKRLLIFVVIGLSGVAGASETIWLGGPADDWAWRPYQAAETMEKTPEALRFSPASSPRHKIATMIWDVPDTLAERVQIRMRVQGHANDSQPDLAVSINCKFGNGSFKSAPARMIDESEGWQVYEADIPKAGMLDAIHFQFRETNGSPFGHVVEIASAELLPAAP